MIDPREMDNEQLWEQYGDFVYYLSLKYLRRNPLCTLNKDELASIGFITLLKAVPTWDSKRGAFTTHSALMLFRDWKREDDKCKKHKYPYYTPRNTNKQVKLGVVVNASSMQSNPHTTDRYENFKYTDIFDIHLHRHNYFDFNNAEDVIFCKELLNNISDENNKRILIEKWFNQKTNREIGKILGISRQAVHERTKKIKQTIAEVVVELQEKIASKVSSLESR